MNKLTTSTAIPTRALKLEALSKISASFELFCLASGMEALGEMMDHDAHDNETDHSDRVTPPIIPTDHSALHDF
jgi:hypothetical protein